MMQWCVQSKRYVALPQHWLVASVVCYESNTDHSVKVRPGHFLSCAVSFVRRLVQLHQTIRGQVLLCEPSHALACFVVLELSIGKLLFVGCADHHPILVGSSSDTDPIRATCVM